MSGFEIAGLVLGGFPILLNILDYYERSFAPLDEWWHFRRHFVQFVDDISQQQMLFQQNLALLLDPVIDDNETFTSLLNDPGATAWEAANLSEILGKRLGLHRTRFLRVLTDMDKLMIKLRKLLGVKDDGSSDWARNGKTWEYELRRLRLSFSKDKTRKVEKLAKLNRALSSLLGWSDTVLPLKERRNTSKLTTKYEKLRQHYFNLYAALICRWQCACSHPHNANLMVQQPSGDMDTLSIDLVFVLPALAAQTCNSAILRKVSANIEQHDANVAAMATEENKLTDALYGLTINAESKQQASSPGFLRISHGKPKSAIKQSPQTKPATAGTIFTQSTTAGARHARFSNQSAQSNSTIKAQKARATNSLVDLCAVLRDDRYSNDGYGCILDHVGRAYSLRPKDPQSQISTSLELRSLSSILTDSSFERQQRFSLAVILIMSLLQLYLTPWAPKAWTKNNVQLLHDGQSWFHNSACFNHPFNSTTGLIGPTAPETGLTLSENQVRHILFSIGVMLLELVFNRPIESHPKRKIFFGPNNQPAEHTDECTAREWSKSVLGECGIEVSDVIRRCLDCSFGPPPNLGDRKFREALQAHVIEPLEQVCERLWASSSKQHP